MKITTETQGQVVVVRLKGALFSWNDQGEADKTALSGLFESLLQDNKNRIILDLKMVRSIDQVGMGCLLLACKINHDAGGRLVVVPGNQTIKRELETTGLDSLWALFDSVEEALRYFESS